MEPDNDFARWMKTEGLSLTTAAAALGLSRDHIRHLHAGRTRGASARPMLPSKTTRLAMAAISSGLAPWSQPDD